MTQKRLITLMTDVLGVLNLRVEAISVITTLKRTPRYVEDILLYPKALACAVCCPSSLASALTMSRRSRYIAELDREPDLAIP